MFFMFFKLSAQLLFSIIYQINWRHINFIDSRNATTTSKPNDTQVLLLLQN